MKLIQRPKIILSNEEKECLKNANEILTNIVEALKNNKENGFAAFQEGLDAPEIFWELKASFYKLDRHELIP